MTSGRRTRRRGLIGVLAAKRSIMVRDAAETRYGTRSRAWAMGLGGIGSLGLLFSLVAGNALAVNFTAANDAHRIFTDRVVGVHAAGYLNAQSIEAGQVPTTQIGFRTAELYGLCAIAEQDLGPLGTVSLVITAGEPVDGIVEAPEGKTIEAEWLFMAASSLEGHGENIQKLTLGQSADTVAMDGEVFPGGEPGAFGLQAELLQVGQLDAQSYGIDLQGQINLPDLRIRVLPGSRDQSDCG